MLIASIVVLLLICLVIGVPIGVALAFVGGVGVLVYTDLDTLMGIFRTVPFRTCASYLLTTCPMFILMAEFASSGITRSLFDFAARRTRRFPASLGVATIFASAILGAICGSSTAAAATMARIAVPDMLRKGFTETMSVGIVAVSGTLAVMIPPSIVLVLYGILADVSIGKLLIGGIVPGLLSAIVYSIVVIIWFKREQMKENIPPNHILAQIINEGQDQAKSIKNEILDVFPAMILIIVVIGGIYSGLVTPTEAAAVGAFATMLLGLAKRDLNLKKIFDASLRAVKTTVMIFTIMIGARIFGYFLTLSQSTPKITQAIENLDTATWIIIAVVAFFYIVLGCLMDGISILLLTIPIMAPIISSLGFDLVWFGIIATKLIEIGLVTPPVGINVFIASQTAGISVDKGFRGSAVLLMGEVVVLLLLLFFPILSLFLPGLMG